MDETSRTRTRNASKEIQWARHLIYFSIIKDIKPTTRGPTLSVFFFLFSFFLAGPGGTATSLFFFPRLATAINQKKRFKPPVWSSVGTQFSARR